MITAAQGHALMACIENGTWDQSEDAEALAGWLAVLKQHAEPDDSLHEVAVLQTWDDVYDHAIGSTWTTTKAQHRLALAVLEKVPELRVRATLLRDPDEIRLRALLPLAHTSAQRVQVLLALTHACSSPDDLEVFADALLLETSEPAIERIGQIRLAQSQMLRGDFESGLQGMVAALPSPHTSPSLTAPWEFGSDLAVQVRTLARTAIEEPHRFERQALSFLPSVEWRQIPTLLALTQACVEKPDDALEKELAKHSNAVCLVLLRHAVSVRPTALRWAWLGIEANQSDAFEEAHRAFKAADALGSVDAIWAREQARFARAMLAPPERRSRWLRALLDDLADPDGPLAYRIEDLLPWNDGED